MTVKRLIELLQALPQELPVYLGDWNEGYAPDIEIDHIDGDSLQHFLPRVAEARESKRWNHPRRVVIG